VSFPNPQSTDRCPCQSGETYGECCGPFHAGAAFAPTAERLMRSRYSAYVIGDADYLRETWHSSTRPASLELDPDIRWFALDIVARTKGGMLDTEGTVEYTASFRVSASDGTADGKKSSRGEQRETSRFVRDGKRWVYLDGK